MKQQAKHVIIWAFLLPYLAVGRGGVPAVQAKTHPIHSIQVTACDSGKVMAHIVSLLEQRIKERSGITIDREGHGQLDLRLEVKPGIGAEGFVISGGADQAIAIVGNDYRGLLYGVGKFLRTSGYLDGSFVPSAWRGTAVPEKSTRGIYFATHFYNYYQTAPIAEVQRYIEDLALWGMNTLMVWFDMHHFNGIADPEAKALLDRLKSYMETAKDLGLDIGFITIGNEGYANSPEALRAIPGGGRGGYYPSAVCPNKPGGLAYIRTIIGEFIDEVSYLDPTYICIWPYDQGGCGGECCQPWGSNGFMKCAEAISAMAKEKVPGIQTIFSTWYFDKQEWEAVKAKFAGHGDWVDLLLAEHVPGYHDVLEDQAVPFPVVAFPEISMHATFPWGGFGATPLPRRIKQKWDTVKDKLDGGFPYSEGIFEDISKVVSLQLYWDGHAALDTVLAEYMAYEFSPDAVAPLLDVVRTLEQNHRFRWWPGKLEGVKLQLDWFPSKNAPNQEDPGAEAAYRAMKQVDASLPEWAKTGWRWRILYIRAMLDAELKRNGGIPNVACLSGFNELLHIYHVTPKTDPVVSPPIPRQIE